MNIDFVVLWVDGNDYAWQKEKKKYEPSVVPFDGGKSRYRDWDLMRYWFRSVEYFAPWVHRIFFVTWGHIPAFLNTNASKLCVVRHEDFIPAKYLPTFNSPTIELNIHRIPELSEHFVYFNDDVFIGKPCKPDLFFRNGMPCAYSVERPIRFVNTYITPPHHFINSLGAVNRNFKKSVQVKKNRLKYVSSKYSWHENMRTLFMERLFQGFFVGFDFPHGPSSFLKSTFDELWEAEPALMDTTSKEKFRTNYQANQYAAVWWQIAKGTIAPAKIDNLYEFISDSTIDYLCDVIVKQQHQFLCLQDSDITIENIEELSAKLQSAFERLLPGKSQFEK